MRAGRAATLCASRLSPLNVLQCAAPPSCWLMVNAGTAGAMPAGGPRAAVMSPACPADSGQQSGGGFKRVFVDGFSLSHVLATSGSAIFLYLFQGRPMKQIQKNRGTRAGWSKKQLHQAARRRWCGGWCRQSLTRFDYWCIIKRSEWRAVHLERPCIFTYLPGGDTTLVVAFILVLVLAFVTR